MTLPLEGRLALVTGASRGIGRASALALAELGADIILVARPRSTSSLEDLDDKITAMGRKATLVPMDLADHDAIDRLGGAVFERWGKLDILLSNAALLGPISPLDHIDVKEWEKLVSVNFTANWRLIRSLNPLLKLGTDPRALFVTTGAVGKHKPYWGAYAATKAGMEELVLTYAGETKISGIKVNLLDPGATATTMRANAVPGEDPSTLPQPADVAKCVAYMLTDFTGNGEKLRYREWAASEAGV